MAKARQNRFAAKGRTEKPRAGVQDTGYHNRETQGRIDDRTEIYTRFATDEEAIANYRRVHGIL